MDFAEWFSRKCAETGDSPSKVSKSIGLSEAIGCYWANGSKIPRKTSIAKVEIYFGEKFNGEKVDNKKSPTAEAAELDEDTITILNLLGKLTPSNRDRAIAYLQGLVAGQS